MIIVYGTRFYGKVRACGRSFLATQFVHIWYLPLIPIGTHLVLDTNPAGGYRTLPAPTSVKSILAGYLRVWGPIAILASIFTGIGTIDDVSDDGAAMLITGVFTAVVTLALLVGTILAWAAFGKLSDTEKQQRSVYALHIGHFVDPADMGPARQNIRDGLLATIMDRGRGLSSMGYRMGADVTQHWPHVALDPTHNDEPLITAALTLARLDASAAEGAYKLQLEQIHSQLWQRITRANPPYLQAHRQFS